MGIFSPVPQEALLTNIEQIRLTRTTNQSIPTGTNTDIIFTGTLQDTRNIWNPVEPTLIRIAEDGYNWFEVTARLDMAANITGYRQAWLTWGGISGELYEYDTFAPGATGVGGIWVGPTVRKKATLNSLTNFTMKVSFWHNAGVALNIQSAALILKYWKGPQ